MQYSGRLTTAADFCCCTFHFKGKMTWNFPKWGEGGERITKKEKGATVFSPYPPVLLGEPCRDRTDNLLIKSQLLYQLS
jgi:hypothetical protein